MSLINVISVPTSHGLKTIEIHNDDITNLNWEYNILVLSAYHKSYIPVANSVIQSLENNLGIILNEIAQNPYLDLRDTLNCWISNQLNNQNFERILCVEGIKSSIEKEGNSESAITNLFGFISLLQYKKIKTTSIAMPILGSGFQNNKLETILSFLIENAVNFLTTNSGVQTIHFVEINTEKALLIDESVNSILKRENQKLETVTQDPISRELLQQALSKLVQIKSNNQLFLSNKTILNLIDKINNESLRFFELGVLSRKLMELLIPEISHLKSNKPIPLYEHLNELKTKNIADWMITYLHTLRIFGNFVAHKDESNEIPDQMDNCDIVVFCHALNRFLDLYIWHSAQTKQNKT